MTGATFESTDGSTFAFTAEPSEIGTRLDALVASRVPALSRSRAAALITAGVVRVGGQAKKPGFRVSEGDLVSGEIPPPQPPSMYGPEPIPLDILYEDAHIIVVNKPAGLVVHPAPGHFSGTLVNGLLHHCPDLSGIGGERRPGIVHRLDKDTSGVLVAAKSEAAQVSLSAQFKRRSVQKTYLALAKGRFEQDSGQIELPVGRHPTLRKKMSTRSRRPRTAHTQWAVVERFAGAALLEVVIRTGRTHQIRVHLAAVGHPVAGDPVYGGKKRRKKKSEAEGPLTEARRQMLHAWRLGLSHPETGRWMEFEAPLPRDFREMLGKLREEQGSV